VWFEQDLPNQTLELGQSTPVVDDFDSAPNVYVDILIFPGETLSVQVWDDDLLLDDLVGGWSVGHQWLNQQAGCGLISFVTTGSHLQILTLQVEAL